MIAFLFLILLFPKGSAQITIDSFTSIPETVQPGEELSIQVHLENVGEEDIEIVVVSLDITDIPFAPTGSSNEQVIKKIDENEEKIVIFHLKALPTAEPQTYKIPVTLSYENVTKVSLISVDVRTDAEIAVLIEDSDLVVINEQGTVTIKVVNSGLTHVKVFQLTLLESTGYEILSPSIAYIGEIDVGDFETEEFIIAPKEEDPELLLQLEYRDAENNEFQEEKRLNLTVYSEEEARALGLKKQGVPVTAILVVIVIVIAIAAFYKRKKRRNHAE